MSPRVPFLALSLTLAAAAHGHDFWITCVPSGESTDVHLRVGHHGDESAVPYRHDRVLRFSVFDADGERAIEPSGDSPAAGRISTTAGREAIVAYEARPSFVSLPGPRFEAYLREEGLDGISRARRDAGRTARAGLESYSRHAKALIASDRAATLGDRVVGLTCELVAERVAASGDQGEGLAVRLLLRGEPVRGARVALKSLSDHEVVEEARTDRDGRVRLGHPGEGAFLITSVHMEPVTDPAARARWRSYWPSLTLVLGARDRTDTSL